MLYIRWAFVKIEDTQERLPYPESMPDSRPGPDNAILAVIKLVSTG